MKKVPMTPEFEAALKGYIEVLNAGLRESYGGEFPELIQSLYPEEGVRYVRVWTRSQREEDDGETRGSAYSFVDKTNGDVLRPDGWKKPAKHARGNIFDGSWVDFAGPHSAGYLAGGFGFSGFNPEAKATAKAAVARGDYSTAEATLVLAIQAAKPAKRAKAAV